MLIIDKAQSVSFTFAFAKVIICDKQIYPTIVCFYPVTFANEYKYVKVQVINVPPKILILNQQLAFTKISKSFIQNMTGFLYA